MKSSGRILEGTPYSGLENKIAKEIARRKNAMKSKEGAASTDDRIKDGVEKREKSKLKNQTNVETVTESTESLGSRKRKVTDNMLTSTTEGTVSKKTNQKSISSEKFTPMTRNQSKLDVPSDGQFNNDRTVYIQGLPFSATEDDVNNLFQSCGTIASIRLPKWHDSGRIKGYGHVEFNSSSSVPKALELSGTYIQERYITVDRPLTPRALQINQEKDGQATLDKPVGCRRIFVKNLPYDITEEDMRNSFLVFGPITNIRLAVWQHTGNLKGETSYSKSCFRFKRIFIS